MSDTEWGHMVYEDEDDSLHFLPTISFDAHEVVEGLYLCGETNVSDVVWLKVTGISRVLTVNAYPLAGDHTHLSESLQNWFRDNVTVKYIHALDTPTQMVIPHFGPALTFISEALDKGEKVAVHCGRGISRSATLVLSTLMHRKKLTYSEAFAVVSSKRACIYPNVGFQLQLFLYEKYGSDPAAAEKATEDFDIAAEVMISMRHTLANIEAYLDSMFDDDALQDEPSRWLDFGYFFQNCREYLGHVDIGLPLALLSKVDDVSRRLRNLGAVFDGRGVDMAVRVGRVMDVWHGLTYRMVTADGAPPRISETYVSKLSDAAEEASALGGEDRSKRRRFS